MLEFDVIPDCSCDQPLQLIIGVVCFLDTAQHLHNESFNPHKEAELVPLPREVPASIISALCRQVVTDYDISNWPWNRDQARTAAFRVMFAEYNNKYRSIIRCRNEKSLTAIPNLFLEKFQYMQAIDMSHLTTVNVIGDSFLNQCTNIIHLNFGALHRVTSIGAEFCFRCTGLMSVDLTSLRLLRTIQDRFLSTCTELTQVNMSSQVNLTYVGRFFLTGCAALSMVELPQPLLLQSAETPSYFMLSCWSLCTVDLRGMMQSVTKIGDQFLPECSGITTLDLAPLSGVTEIGDFFLVACSALTSLDLTPLVDNLNRIGNAFLYDCAALESIKSLSLLIARIRCGELQDSDDFSHPKRTLIVGNDFLGGCPDAVCHQLDDFEAVK